MKILDWFKKILSKSKNTTEKKQKRKNITKNAKM